MVAFIQYMLHEKARSETRVTGIEISKCYHLTRHGQCGETDGHVKLTLAHGRFGWNFILVIFKLTLAIDGWGIFREIALRWVSPGLTDDTSLVQVMAWCRQATSHYMSQCRPKSISPCGVTRPQRVNTMSIRSCHYTAFLQDISDMHMTVTSYERPGGRFKNTYELLNLRALKFSYVNKIHIFQCMGKIFCVEFQRYPLKFHTKYLTHTLKDMIFMQFWNFKSS